MADYDNTGFGTQYSDKSFWDTLKAYALAAGRDVIEKALILYYTARSPATPAWAKAAIYAALGYFVSLIDAIPDLTPIIGYADDLGVLVAAIATVASTITPEIREQAAQKLQEWFETPPAS
jgi:uncharacterized membrane protein YkvA (DUF1232 family)